MWVDCKSGKRVDEVSEISMILNLFHTLPTIFANVGSRHIALSALFSKA